MDLTAGGSKALGKASGIEMAAGVPKLRKTLTMPLTSGSIMGEANRVTIRILIITGQQKNLKQRPKRLSIFCKNSQFY
jgi:hypothetical protein